MLKVKLLTAAAKAPTVAHPGEDLGYDIFAAETVTFAPRGHPIVPTGMASRRLVLTGGVIDSGYRGEIKVLMENLSDQPATINAGDKLANLIPYPVLTGKVEGGNEL